MYGSFQSKRHYDQYLKCLANTEVGDVLFISKERAYPVTRHVIDVYGNRVPCFYQPKFSYELKMSSDRHIKPLTSIIKNPTSQKAE